MDLKALFGLLRRRVLPILLCALVGATAGVLSWQQAEPVYRAESSVLLGLPGAQTTAEAAQGIQISSQLLQSYSRIVQSRSLAADVKARLGLPDSVGHVRSRLSASVQPQTLYINVSGRADDPEAARLLTDAATAALVRRMGALQADRDRSTRVTATVIDVAEPGRQTSPRPAVDVGAGLAVGLLAGLALALAIDGLDRRVTSAAQLHELSGLPVLATVPRMRRREPVVTPLGKDPVSESYRALRTAVRFINPDSTLRTIAVTSPGEAEGKTTTAVNLAVALAESGERVLLVDADLRRAGLARALGIEGAVGLSNAIVGDVAVDDALQDWRGLLTVLPAGTLPPNPSELLGSFAMGELLEKLEARYDVIVLDAPPALPVTDAVVLATLVDGLVLVVRSAQTTRPAVAELRRRLETVGAPVLGCVLNAAPTSALAYDEGRPALPTA